MACNGTSCESGCYKDDDQKKQSTNGELTTVTDNHLTDLLCLKCKSNVTIAATYGGDNGGDGSKFCADCFRGNLFGKFKFAVTSNAMISPSDNVLVAFSGGTSSRVVLQFVHEMQHKAQKNFDASRDRSLPVFGVGVAFVDQSAFYPVPSYDFDEAVEAMKLTVYGLDPPRKAFHVIPIESIFNSDSNAGREKLKELLTAVTDKTGKEDLLVQLRMLSLQKIALENGYTKIILGTCTSRIACHVIAATVKSIFIGVLKKLYNIYLHCLIEILPQLGQGYSLAADIQYVDARSQIPVVLPLRDCLAQELNMFCRLDRLKTFKLYNGSGSSINGLISSFVKLLQEENPSRECTIIRTAGKLTSFHFNKIPETDDCSLQLASRRRQKKFNLKSNESLPPDSFCPICNSPLDKNNFLSLTSENGQTSPETLVSKCCASCQFQILPKEPLYMEHFYSLLPQSITERAKNVSPGNHKLLREQIQDCLLSDSEDGT